MPGVARHPATPLILSERPERKNGSVCFGISVGTNGKVESCGHFVGIGILIAVVAAAGEQAT
jgi:hypothetical protein